MTAETRRTNDPGTCLHCGKRLGIYFADRDFLFREKFETEADFLARIDEVAEEGWVVASRRYRPGDEEDDERGELSVVGLTKANARRGVYGAGFFHSKSCAARFGVAFALAGYRLQPRGGKEGKRS